MLSGDFAVRTGRKLNVGASGKSCAWSTGRSIRDTLMGLRLDQDSIPVKVSLRILGAWLQTERVPGPNVVGDAAVKIAYSRAALCSRFRLL